MIQVLKNSISVSIFLFFRLTVFFFANSSPKIRELHESHVERAIYYLISTWS